MFGSIFLFFYATPITLIILLGVSIYRYVSAKKRNKAAPGTFSDEVIKERKFILIGLSILTGVFAAVVVGCMVLLISAVANM